MVNKSKGGKNSAESEAKNEVRGSIFQLPAVPASMSKEQQAVIDNFIKNYPLPPVQTPFNFFKQQRAMNYKNFIYMRKQEGPVLKRHMAALCIQTYVRGWLVRTNMKLLNGAAIKIQSLWRRAIARELYHKLCKLREEKRFLDKQNKAATRIQAAWRGFWSRKNKFDFKKFVELKIRNDSLQESAEWANDLEVILSPGESTTSDLRPSTSFSPSEDVVLSDMELSKLSEISAEQSEAIEILKELMASGDLEDLVAGISGASRSRINELVTNLQLSKKGCICSTSSEVLRNPRLSIRRRSMPDSILQMFPSLPDSDKMVQPDSEKVRALKYAIQSLREKAKDIESQKLYKLHHLSRTAVLPGIYSDIYSSRFTEMEKKLRSLRFWTPEKLIPQAKERNPPPTPSLIDIKDEEEMMLEKIYNFNARYMPPGYDLETMNRIPKPRRLKKIIVRPRFIACFK